jgi:hypothetical protein
MKKPGRDARLVEPHVGKYLGNLKRMNKIRLAGGTRLTAVM